MAIAKYNNNNIFNARGTLVFLRMHSALEGKKSPGVYIEKRQICSFSTATVISVFICSSTHSITRTVDGQQEIVIWPSNRK